MRPLAFAESLERRLLLCADHHPALAASDDSSDLFPGWDQHLYPTEDMLAESLAAARGDGIGAASAWTTGNKSVLYIRVAFSNNPTAEPQSLSGAQSMMATVDQFMQDNSYGLLSMTTTFTDLVVLPQNEDYYIEEGNNKLLSDARAAAKAAGIAAGQNWDYQTYNLDAVRFSGGPGTYGGLAFIGARGVWLKSSSAGVAAHEFGHNLGLHHANYWDPTDDFNFLGPGENDEYGDDFSTMGAASAGKNHFNAYEKNKLDWIPGSNVYTVTTGGLYTIDAHDLGTFDPASKYAIKIRKDSDRDYWLEFRQHSQYAVNSDRWVLSGLGVRWDRWLESNNGSHLLDTTPESSDGKKDSPIVIGRTWTDDVGDIHITPISKNGSSLDVVVNFGSFPGENAPALNLSASATTVSTGATVTFTADATDADGDTLAYHWDFGDRNFGPNSAVATKSWSTAGEYRVRLTVSDMKGRSTSKSVIVRVGNPSTQYRISGRVTDPFGNPMSDVRIHNSLATTSSNYRIAYTDSDGTYTLTGLPAGSYTISAARADANVAINGFNNPVTVSPSATNINFIATPITYRITGRVTDAAGNGVKGALVSDGHRTEPTNASGNYTLSGVPSGAYTLTATKPGYTFSFPGNGAVQVGFANATANAAEVTYTVSGVITGITGGGTITVTDGNSTVTAAGSGATRTFSIRVPAGTWFLRASSSSASFSPSFTTPLTVSGNLSALSFTQDSVRSFAVSGRVMHLSSGLAGATITLDQTGPSIQTDSRGRYHIPGLSFGSHQLAISHPDHTFTSPTRDFAILSADVSGQDFVTTSINAPPGVITPASAQLVSGSSTTVTLTALADDDAGAEYLTYTWSLDSAPAGANVIYSSNNSSAAKNALAILNRAGSYTFLVTIRDLDGFIASSAVTIDVAAVTTGITVTPANPIIYSSAQQQFTANLVDQFGQPVAPQPTISWSRSGGGSISSTGLFTAGASLGGPFTITASGGGKSGAAKVTVTAAPGVGAGIRREWWTNISGTAISNLTSNPNYPNSPTGAQIISSTGFFEAPTDWADNYGTRMRGYFIAPVSGSYTFFIASDDASELYISTDINPNNKSRRAFVSSWTDSREWDKYSSQKSTAISMIAGRRYYIEAIQKEGSGGDNLAVGVQLPGGILERPIPAHRIEPWGTPTASITAGSVNEGASASFAITLSGPALANLTIPYTLSGNAVSGSDFSTLSGTLFIPQGATSATITVTTLSDGIVETSETLRLSLGIAGGYLLPAAGAAANMTIVDTTPPLTASMTPADPDPRNTEITSLAITFNRPVIGVDLTDFILARSGTGVSLSSASVTTSDDGLTWTLSGLADRTAPAGDYTLTLNAVASDIVDANNNSLLDGALETWTVSSTLDFPSTASDDSIRLALSPIRPGFLEVFLNDTSTPAMQVHLESLTSVTFDGQSGNDTLTLDAALSIPIHFIGGDGADAFITSTTASPTLDSTVESLLAKSGAEVTIPAGTTLTTLTLESDSRLNLLPGADGLLDVTDLTLASTAILDLATHDLIVRGGTLAGHDLLNYIASFILLARADGSWSGPGIRTSPTPGLTLAPILNNNGNNSPLLSSFGGAAVDAQAILVKRTYFGDANLDGRITIADFLRIDRGFARNSTGWQNGDFDLSGAIDATDYSLIDNAFMTQGSPAATNPAPAAIPASSAYYPSPFATPVNPITPLDSLFDDTIDLLQ